MRNSSRQLVIAAGIAVTSFAAFGDTDPAVCHSSFLDQQAECQNTFNDPQLPGHHNQHAFETCNDGARARLESCLLDNPGNTSAHWDEFTRAIRNCLHIWPGGGDGLETCLEGALMVYRHKLGLQPADPCGLTPVGTGRTAPMDTLRSAAIELGETDGAYPVEVQTTLSFQAGVSTTHSYNLAARPCIAKAQLIAIYQTKDGPRSISIDADTDTSDGVFFDLPIFANRVADTNRMVILALYHDAQMNPVFMEYAHLSILDSPIQGDWNRDGVQNTQDILDFLVAHASGVERSDLNADGLHDTIDIIEFLTDL